MNNGDNPIHPLSGDAYTDFSCYDENSKNTSYNPQCQGLTKREHFAGLALQGYLISGDRRESVVRDSIRRADELLLKLKGNK